MRDDKESLLRVHFAAHTHTDPDRAERSAERAEFSLFFEFYLLKACGALSRADVDRDGAKGIEETSDGVGSSEFPFCRVLKISLILTFLR